MHNPPPTPSLLWLRQDLRLHDNPALCAAVEAGGPVIPVYIMDSVEASACPMGGASRWWLHHSLAALRDATQGHLVLMQGDPAVVLPALIRQTGAKAVFWNRCYEPWRMQRDARLKADLRAEGIGVHSHNGSLLFEPHTVTKSDGTPYKVFTPFFKKGCLAGQPPRVPLPVPEGLTWAKGDAADQVSLDGLALLPQIGWDAGFHPLWQPGEAGAHSALSRFISSGLDGYKEGRNFPQKPHVSRLSPHLHFGEISPNTAWYAAECAAAPEADKAHFLSELAWREFSYTLLYQFPELPTRNFQEKFDAFPWRDDPAALRCWQRGQTGYPIVDAGMRELWQTGYMHNRVRMIAASFLIKHLLIDWRLGEAWFWDTLLDADLANNSASWQWVAGSGADAAPYFRIFNPIIQGKKFDPEGAYIRHYVPELARLDTRWLYAPWEAPQEVLAAAGVVLGQTYPLPMVGHEMARDRALAAFSSLSAA